ncbi:GspH/FimT family pseudopilin [Curvibacter lanceolatus]|jgi:type IV fimbrial biogenesis protein FimT|uniref:GspH/FimT family pseudopilin n=1 Tax=Curvibacter lanceolatus TaxID=86182 RepID=UPI0003A54E19|nr:GspH/FimT family pseudopilin [Curvibacter lanceolatus]
MRLQQGFTLLELLVSIAIVAIMVRLAVPSYQFIINSSRISGELNGLLTSFQFARAEAVRRGLSVTVCSSANGTSCSSTNNWKSGWLVFVDVNNNASLDAGDTVLRQQATLASANTVVADNSVSTVRFNREGIAAGLPADPVTFTFTPPSNASTQKRCLAVGAAGRMTVELPGVGGC